MPINWSPKEGKKLTNIVDGSGHGLFSGGGDQVKGPEKKGGYGILYTSLEGTTAILKA